MITFNNNTYQEMSPWEAWISRHFDNVIDGMTRYDHLCEMAVSSYNLNKKTKNQNMKDRVHLFLEWWLKNKRFMKKYSTTQKVGNLLGIEHCTVLHYCGTRYNPPRRKKTSAFNKNVECIKDFLEL